MRRCPHRSKNLNASRAELIVESFTGKDKTFSSSLRNYSDVELLINARKKFDLGGLRDKENIDHLILEYSVAVLGPLRDLDNPKVANWKELEKSIFDLVKEYDRLWRDKEWTKQWNVDINVNSDILAFVVILLSICKSDKVYQLFFDLITNKKFPNANNYGYTKWTAWVSGVLLPKITESDYTDFLLKKVNQNRDKLLEIGLESEDKDVLQIFRMIRKWISKSE